MYSFIWISWGGADFKDKRPKGVSKVTQYPELRGTIMSLELCDSDLTAPTLWSHSQGGGWLRESRSCDIPLWRGVVRDIPMQKSTLSFYTPPSYQATPSSLSPVWPYFQIPFQLVENFRHIYNKLWSHHPLLSPSSSSGIPHHTSPQLNVVLKNSNIHAQL